MSQLLSWVGKWRGWHNFVNKIIFVLINMTFSSNPTEFMNNYKPIINLRSKSCIQNKKRTEKTYFFHLRGCISDLGSLEVEPWESCWGLGAVWVAVEGVGGVRRVGAGLGWEDGHIQGRHCKQEVFRKWSQIISHLDALLLFFWIICFDLWSLIRICRALN